MNVQDWLPALSTIALGIITGSWAAFRLQRGAPAPDSARDLDDAAEILAAELGDLNADRERMTGASYEQQRARLDARAECVAADRRALPAVEPAVCTARSSSTTGFLWGMATTGVVAMLLFSVSQQSTATPEQPAMAQGEAPSAEMTALAARLQAQPDDVEAMVRLGHLFLRQQALREAQVLTERALQLDPDHGEARVHQAVLAAAQDPENGLAALDALLQKDPSLAEGWFFRGMLAMQSGDTEGAKTAWAQFVAVAPEGPQKERIRGFLAGRGLQMPAP